MEKKYSQLRDQNETSLAQVAAASFTVWVGFLDLQQ